MKKYLTFLSFFLLNITLNCQSVLAVYNQAIDAYNNLYYPQSLYNYGINFTPQSSMQDGYVNIATGSANVTVTDLSLPGVNGFDLNITRTYNSTNASLFEAYLKETEESYGAKYYMIRGTKSVYQSFIDSDYPPESHYDVCLTRTFKKYCEEKDLSPRRFKNTLALLKQVLNYSNDKGFTNNTFNL